MKIFKKLLLTLCFLIPATLHAAPIGQNICKNSDKYICYTVKKNDSWKKLFPDSRERDLVMRINRMNIPLKQGLRIAIPKKLETHISEFSPFPNKIVATGQKKIHVSVHPHVLAWGAYDKEGNHVGWGPAVGGKSYCPDVNRSCRTKLGSFTLYRKGGSGCASSKYPIPTGGAPMPWCMFFHGGYALHGSHTVPGVNASHGCIRLFVADAKWLNKEFAGNDKVGVTITNIR